MNTFIQSSIKLTKSQLNWLNSVTRGMNSDTKKFFIHTLKNQLSRRILKDYESWKGVPIPRTFIHKHCRNYKYSEVKDFITRKPYFKEFNICFRYRLKESLIDEFILAGEDFLLSWSAIQDDWFYDQEGNSLNKLIKPFSSASSTPIDLGFGMGWLKKEKERLETVTDIKVRDSQYRRYLHNLSCYQGMLERLTSIDYKKRRAEYSQELIQPDKGLRSYELGGGLQGASRNFREMLLITSPVINYDAVKCHATIAHQEMKKHNIDSGLQELLDGTLSSPHPDIPVSLTKTAILATINGARVTCRLNKRLTIPRLIIEAFPESSRKEQKLYLRALVDYLSKTANAVKQWSKTIPKHKRIAKVSALLQSIEVEELKPLLNIACNNQHDGALVRTDINLQTTLPPKSQNNRLRIVAKPISQPDPNNSEIICGQEVKILLLNLLEGPTNMVDIIMATGDRLQAVNNSPKNTKGVHNQDQQQDTDSSENR